MTTRVLFGIRRGIDRRVAWFLVGRIVFFTLLPFVLGVFWWTGWVVWFVCGCLVGLQFFLEIDLTEEGVLERRY